MKQVEALADYHRRMAELQQAIGGALPSMPAEEVPAAIRNKTTQ